MNKLKEKIKNHERLIGTHISMGNYILADAFAQMGFDFIWVDTEHSVIDYNELLQCITVIRAHGTPVIVRAHINEPGHVKRILEMGVDGIIFPNLETKEQIKDAIRSTAYPPVGYRGFGPLGAVRYGLDDVREYVKKDKKLCRFFQIEQKATVENLDDILADELVSEYVDGYIFGPCDLAGSIGLLPDIYADENIALIKKAVEKVEAAGGYLGVSIGSVNQRDQKYWMDIGCRMISAGTDYEYAVQGALANAKQLDSLRKEIKE